MHVVIEQAKLKKALDVAAEVVERANVMPVLGNVLIETDEAAGGVNCKATNMTALACMFASAKVVKPGRTTAPADRLKDIVSTFPAKSEITIVEDSRKLVVKSGSSEYKLLTIPAEDFPKWEINAGIARFTVNWDTLKLYIRAAVYAVPNKDHRRVFTGMNAAIGDGCLALSATDGKKIARMQMPVPEMEGKKCNITMPRDFVEVLEKYATMDPITIEICPRQVTATCEALGFTVVANGIEGAYPDLMAFIPREFAMVVIVERAVLLKAAESAQKTTDDKNRAAIFSFGPDGASVSSMAHDVGTHYSEFECKGAKTDVQLAFKSTSLIDMLERIPTSEIEMCVKNTSSPVVFRAPGHTNKVWAQMPFRPTDLNAAAAATTDNEESE